jgi:hypothetical protein
MKLHRLPNGNLLIPVGGHRNGIDFDFHEEIAPNDPRYEEWATFLGTGWEEPLSEEAIARWLERASVPH